MQTGERVIYEECGTSPEFKGALTAFVCRIIDNITKEALREQKKNTLIRETLESDLTAEIEDFKTEREVGLLLFENKALVSAVLSLTEKQQKCMC